MKIKPEEEWQLKGPYGLIQGVLTPCVEENTVVPVLVLAHGFRGSMEGGGRAAVLAELASECCHVIRFNFSSSQILSKQIEELEAVLAYVGQKFADSRIFLLGRSMGGAAALVTAARREDIAGLVLWATPNDLPSTFKKALGSEGYEALVAGQTLYLNDERGELTLTPDFVTDFARYDLQGILRGWRKRPLLILHGEKDETVALEQARLAFALAGVPKKLVIISGGDHSFTNHGNKAAAEVVNWLKARMV
ncbi:alpha/beta fold hydrolase [Phascolarctobacterium sp.]|uniref:alpha/beta hydrolase n=1 Tax=Phascolarctobacterium sp. TaxID=2049039 RepID=UPI0015AA77F9|nr:alpha/beta fold hydrolase [uncultured Phascolarctobacterium sp.]